MNNELRKRMRLDLQRFKCAIFDLDGTLLDSSGLWEKVDRDFLGKRGIEVPDDYINDIKKHNFQTGSVYTVERFHLQEDPKDIANEWMEMVKEEYHHSVHLKANAKEYLQYLKKQGLKLAVATSSDEQLFRECLIRNGIYDLFDSFTVTHEVENGKGCPDVYEKAASKCGVTNEECIVFEDILMAVIGAKKGDFYTVGVYDIASERDRERIKELSDVYITDYIELM